MGTITRRGTQPASAEIHDAWSEIREGVLSQMRKATLALVHGLFFFDVTA